MRTTAVSDFSGGWNPRDAWSAVADNELPDALNITLDERGGITKRLGLTKYNVTQIATGQLENLWYSAALNLILAQQGTTLYKSVPGSGTFASFATLASGARVCFVDFLGKVYFASLTDAFKSYDGTTVSAAIANAPLASMAAVWQNAIWSGGDPGAPTRVMRSDLGAGAWTVSPGPPVTPVTVDIRVHDDKPLTAMGSGAGMDTQGRGGMLVFKEDSTYRIYDSEKGAYTVLSATHGAGGPLAVHTSNGITFAVSTKGIIGMIGDDTEPKILSSKVDPVFHPAQLNMTRQGDMVACRYHERLLFSLSRSGSNVNNLVLEMHPDQGWIVPHSFGLACATTVERSDASTRTSKLFGGASSAGYVYEVFKGGSDDGVPISARAQIRWREPSQGNQCRWRRLIVMGRGKFNLYFKHDYAAGIGELYPVEILGESDVWGGGVYWGDGSLWGADQFQGYSQSMYSLGHGRAYSFEIQESSSTSSVGSKLLDDGVAEETGAFSLYGFSIQHQELGLS